MGDGSRIGSTDAESRIAGSRTMAKELEAVENMAVRGAMEERSRPASGAGKRARVGRGEIPASEKRRREKNTDCRREIETKVDNRW